MAYFWRKTSILRQRVNRCSACLPLLEVKNIAVLLSADLKATCQLSLLFSSTTWGKKKLDL